jgi:hypothetical protein
MHKIGLEKFLLKLEDTVLLKFCFALICSSSSSFSKEKLIIYGQIPFT